MSDHNSASEQMHEHTSEHIASIGSCLGIWLALIAGTTLTVAAAFIDLGPFNTVVALAIATTKATLVVLFYMHVKYTHEKLTGLVIVSAIFFLFILLALSMADYGSRLWG
ncbi:MAG TPA: cytochrome C oxidase subunit IV family protein [Terriglobales bacterium]|nr:cytochrome C oxidase subunit IV family protein [Terriglobales bacterium]